MKKINWETIITSVVAISLVGVLFYGAWWIATPRCSEFTLSNYRKGDVPVRCENYWSENDK